MSEAGSSDLRQVTYGCLETKAHTGERNSTILAESLRITDEVHMSRAIVLALATLLIASVSFAQAAPVAPISDQPTTETFSGPFSNMTRAE